MLVVVILFQYINFLIVRFRLGMSVIKIECNFFFDSDCFVIIHPLDCDGGSRGTVTVHWTAGEQVK